MITINGLSKSYGRRQPRAIQGVDFQVNDGEIVGFVGLNGAGKTTTIRVAAGVSLPTEGSVTVDGHNIVEAKAEASALIGWVPELPNFELNEKALSLMKYFSGFYGVPPSDAQAKSLELLAAVGLAGAEKKKLREYSQGMKKRFSLAASMLSDPKNFLFDELLNGLDPAGIHYFRNLVLDLRKQGKAVLLSSHILSEVENLADRVVFIHKGKVVKTVGIHDLGAAGTDRLRVTIQNLDDGAVSFLKTLGDVSAEGNQVRLASPKLEASEVNAQLVKKGYLVSELAKEKTGLEDYFFDLVKAADGG